MKAGRELDALIAERVMGWKVVYSDEPVVVSASFPYPFPFNPSTDISDAWQVVEKLQSLGMTVHIIASKDGWYSVDVWVDGTLLYTSDAETAPLAIVKASLKAKGVKIE
jgi:alkyl hydroperoxide reductase subunit AhpC